MINRNASRQLECLKVIYSEISIHGTSPTRSEIGRKMGITRESAHLLVDKLLADQLVNREPERWRNLTITPLGLAVVRGKVDFHSAEAMKLRSESVGLNREKRT